MLFSEDPARGPYKPGGLTSIHKPFTSVVVPLLWRPASGSRKKIGLFLVAGPLREGGRDLATKKIIPFIALKKIWKMFRGH